ncbi:hypothetical protein OBBRIDRAFT_873170 [Obba rivulosa]|uniref:Uncharacterized protein n=1 Tax=Obba rivulosa TaxID=1052685 RepID=A0A8E2B4E1_9APHY|nr:hypothetical protein OBBRIDRAFT_873170 [Obba rivulosa]
MPCEELDEKSAYDEVEIIQGSVTARCYGLFWGHLESGHNPIGWDTSKYETEPAAQEISVLLLERLGDPLSRDMLGHPFPSEIIDEWEELLDDFNELNIFYRDLHRRNILRAPRSPPGLPTRECPVHRKQHAWRIIDLGCKREKNWLTTDARRVYHRQILRDVKQRWEMGDDSPLSN